MELALYHPSHGYYERNLKQTGREGDFYTSVSVGSLYGEMLGMEFARRLGELWPGNVSLIEAGAHDGQLACDVLSYLGEYQKHVFRRVEYVIIEPSVSRAHRQVETLLRFQGKVRWVRSWEEIGEFRGICFSNELLDAMPVHVFGGTRLRRIGENGASRMDQGASIGTRCRRRRRMRMRGSCWRGCRRNCWRFCRINSRWRFRRKRCRGGCGRRIT